MPAQGLSFLVVESQPFQRNLYVRLLRTCGATTVLSAATAREALHVLKNVSRRLDVLMTEIEMQPVDGLELMRYVGAVRACASVVATRPLDRGLIACVEAMSAAYGLNFLGAVERPLTARRLADVLRFHQPLYACPIDSETVPLEFSAQEIVEALENGEFEPFFQPKIDVRTWHVTGAEALARWRHPQSGIVLPHAFIKRLEDAGKMHMLLRSILRQSAAFARKLRESGFGAPVAVNLSFKSLSDPTLAEQITTVIASQNVEPHEIVLEITEAAASAAQGPALENLARLRMKGFGLALDDYGRGHSCIEQLARIPFTEMKIDQPFVFRACRHESARVVLESSLDMARKLDIRAIGEGVETQANCDLLAQLNCDMAQGDYLAKPMSRSAYIAWIRRWTNQRKALGAAY